MVSKVKISGSEKKSEQEQVRHFLHKTCVTRTFLEVSRCSRAKQRKRNGKRECDARAKLLFC